MRYTVLLLPGEDPDVYVAFVPALDVVTQGESIDDAVRAARLPSVTPYAWVAGESSMVRAVRRHLVGERGIDRTRVTFTGYWRRGASEDTFRAEQ